MTANVSIGDLPLSLQSVSELAAALQVKRTTSCIDVSAVTIVFFDFLLSFQSEVQHIWKRQWSLVKVLFLITRYLPFIDLPVTLLIHDSALGNGLSSRGCTILWNVQCWSYVIGFTLANGILSIRTLAVWNRNKIVLFVLLSLLSASIAAAFSFTERYVNGGILMHNTFPSSLYPGCLVTPSGDALTICYVILLAYETVIFLLTIARAAYSDGAAPSNLYLAIYRDGILFYFYLLAVSITNIVLLVTTSGSSTIYLASLHRALHAVLAERLILNIRSVGTPPDISDLTVALTVDLDAVGQGWR